MGWVVRGDWGRGWVVARLLFPVFVDVFDSFNFCDFACAGGGGRAFRSSVLNGR